MFWAWGLFLLASLPPAATPVELRWQFHMGQTFYVKETLRIQQRLRMPDTQEKQALEQTRVSRFQVRELGADGSVVLEQKIVAVQVQAWSPGRAADTDWLRPFQGAVFRLTLDSKHRVRRLEGVEALRTALVRQKPEAAELAEVLLRQENLQHPLELLFSFAPDKPVVPGASWQYRYSPVPLANLANLKLTDTYTYSADEKEKQRLPADRTGEQVLLSVATTVKVEPPTPIGRLPFRSVRQQVTLPQSQGYVLFDSRRGRLQERQREWVLQGVFALQVGFQEIEVELEQQQHYHMRVLDRPPDGKKPQ